MAAAKEVGMNAAIAAVLSELDYISSFKEEQRTAFKAFLYGKYVLVFPSVVLPQRDRQIVHPVTSQLISLNDQPLPNTVYGPFPRWTCEIYPMDM